MRILGIDPGTATVGYGIIETSSKGAIFIDAGVISTSKSEADGDRLYKIHDQIDRLIKKHKAEILALEKVYFSKNIKTAISVAQARGVIMLAAVQNKLKIIECSPQDVKMGVAGYGAAGKKQVQKMIAVLLKLKNPPKSDDAADALAAALSAVNRLKNF